VKSPFFERLARNFPDLELKLTQACINEKPVVFLRKVFMVAFSYTALLSFAFFLFLVKLEAGVIIVVAAIHIFCDIPILALLNC